MMGDIGKAGLAVTHSFIAVSIGAIYPTPIGIAIGALVAYQLVFY